MTAGGDRAALERLLGSPATAWLLDRIRSRVLAAEGVPLTGTIVLNAPTPEQRAAVAALIGPSRRVSATLRVDLAAVEEVLRRGPWPAGLADAVEVLTGPVVDHRSAAAAETDAWRRIEQSVEDAVAVHEAITDEASRERWRTWCARGAFKRMARAEADRTGGCPPLEAGQLLGEQVVRVLAALPASGEPLSVLARRTVGDAHGLDADRPLGRLALVAVTAAFGAPTSASRREVWSQAGVMLSNVSSTVLCLGVSGAQHPEALSALGHATAVSLSAMRTARAPALLTIDQVRSGGVGAVAPDGVVHVCENPTVIELVADRWSAGAGPGEAEQSPSPVLVCTSGQPSAAVLDILDVLTSRGAECRYHGDFDWGGLRIAATVTRRVQWTPWRFSAESYLEAVDAHDLPSRPLAGSPAASPWDPALAEAMTRAGLAVEEEAVADLLVTDLLGADLLGAPQG